MSHRAILLTVGFLGVTIIGVYFIQQSLKTSVNSALATAATPGGTAIGKGAVDALFANVQTLLTGNGAPKTA